MEFKLNRDNIIYVASKISEKFREFGYYNDIKVGIDVDERTFKKIDEDLYYRNNPEGKDFIPSDDMIIVTYGKVEVDITKTGENAE